MSLGLLDWGWGQKHLEKCETLLHIHNSKLPTDKEYNLR